MDKIAKMHEILDMVMEINEGCVKRQGKGHSTAFFVYSGHINVCDVEIHFHGWVPDYDYTDENEFIRLHFNLNDDFSNYNFARLKGIVERIKDERSNMYRLRLKQPTDCNTCMFKKTFTTGIIVCSVENTFLAEDWYKFVNKGYTVGRAEICPWSDRKDKIMDETYGIALEDAEAGDET